MINEKKITKNFNSLYSALTSFSFDGCAIKRERERKILIHKEDDGNCKWKSCFFIARSLRHLLACRFASLSKSEIVIGEGEREGGVERIVVEWRESRTRKRNLFKAFSCFVQSFFVNYRLMIVKNFINAIRRYFTLFLLFRGLST